MNNYIISISYEDDGLRIWDRSTYESIKTIEDIKCYCSNGISKLENNKIIIGGENKIFILDVISFQYNSFQDQQLGWIQSICVLKNGDILIGNLEGEIIKFDLSSKQIIFKKKIHNERISCIIESEDNKIFSSSYDGNINVYY